MLFIVEPQYYFLGWEGSQDEPIERRYNCLTEFKFVFIKLILKKEQHLKVNVSLDILVITTFKRLNNDLLQFYNAHTLCRGVHSLLLILNVVFRFLRQFLIENACEFENAQCVTIAKNYFIEWLGQPWPNP